MKNICLITPGHISSNPRLVKEAIALTEAGYQIHIIFVQNLSFLIKNDEAILDIHPTWTYAVLDNTSKKLRNKLIRILKSLFTKVASFSLKYKLTLLACRVVANRNYYWQLNEALKAKAQIYIAHNLGALPIAYHVARKNNAKYGFDAEDFHRYEITNDKSSIAYRLTKHLEDHYITAANYVTAASPLIANAYEKEYPELAPDVINNVFSSIFIEPIKKQKPNGLRLFWFSQTIGKGRGLEDVIRAIGLLENPSITLALLGNVSESDKQYFVELSNKSKLIKDQLVFSPTIAGDKIFKLANQYDIGLALEQATPLNRDICLTNKIFTYIASGIAIIATDTTAQNEFLATYPSIGKVFTNGDTDALASAINFYYENNDQLIEAKNAAHQLAMQQLNWENESKVFLQIINNIH